MKLLCAIMLTMSIMFMLMQHPLSVGLMLLMYTITVSMLMTIIIKNSWFSYILIITIISGVLVLFMYMASVSSNEKIKLNLTMIVMAMILTPMNTLIIKSKVNFNLAQWDLMMNMSSSLSNLFSQSMMITIMFVIYLLYTMIIVSFVVKNNSGPMRTKTAFEKKFTQSTPTN